MADPKEFLDPGNSIAVVGVNQDPKRFGYKIFKDMQGAGFRVFPVNPRFDSLEGERVFPDLASLPETPDVVDIVVPPAVALKVLEQVNALGIGKVWLQPGSESPEAIAFCAENGIEVLHHCCMMAYRRTNGLRCSLEP